MTKKEALRNIRNEIESGMKLDKCRKCGCMKDVLTELQASLPLIKSREASGLIGAVEARLREPKPIEYACLGCKYCFGAEAANSLAEIAPPAVQPPPTGCGSGAHKAIWPPAPGEYFTFPVGPGRPVAVSTLASTTLPEILAKLKPAGLAIVGKTETENTGIDKIIKNTISNPAVRYLIIAGVESLGHLSGQTLLALSEKGVDKDMRVISSPGKRPILKNVSTSEIESFRRQVRTVNMIGCKNPVAIIAMIKKLSIEKIPACGCGECPAPAPAARPAAVPKIKAGEPKALKMDKAGYFVVIPANKGKLIIVEHYSYDNKLLHVIEGSDAPSVYSAIIEKGWLSELSHAAYLGRELAKAELCLKHGFKYIQDKAPGKEEASAE